LSIVSEDRMSSPVVTRPGLRRTVGLMGLTAALLWSPGASADSGKKWEAQGPGPNTQGQVEGIARGEVSGAVHTIVAHPTNPDKLWIGAVNGGVWETDNATDADVHWKRLTDEEQSNSIGALDLDPTDSKSKTLVAGIGRFSSFGSTGGARIGLLRSTDSGKNWTVLNGGGILVDKNISGVAARGNVLVVSVNTALAFTFGNVGIWRSADGGATFQQISNGNGAATGLPGGITNDLVGVRGNPNRLFTSVHQAEGVGGQNGIYRSDDAGATWSRVSTANVNATIISGITSNIELATGRHNNVYAAIVNSNRLFAVFRSGDGGATWVRMDLPLAPEGAPQTSGVHPGAQGFVHLSIVADPTDANIVYIGGDRQPWRNEPLPPVAFPNAIGAQNFTGRIFRGNASLPTGSQWVHITHSSSLGAPGGGTASNTAPHADSREMTFDAAGNLLESDDGGIYRRTSPRTNTGDWFTMIGNLQAAETHSASYDTVSNIVLGGAQDTGVPIQDLPDQVVHSSLLTADGGDTAVDSTSTPGFSTRFSSNQNLGNFVRTVWDAQNNFISFVFPSRTVIGGPPIQPQFYTPVVTHNVDGNRIALAGNNGIFESFDQGDTFVHAGPGVTGSGSGIDPLAYGAADNPDILYAGSGARVFVRTAPYPTLMTQSLTFPGIAQNLVVTDIVLNPADGDTAFVSNTTTVYRTTDAGATWTNVTGNLQTLVPLTVRCLAFAGTPYGDAIIVGSQNGVYYATAASGFTSWQRLATELPTVPVFDLQYDAADDVLIAGTAGRGIWKLSSFSKNLRHGADEEDD
jgi:hypothetical protein